MVKEKLYNTPFEISLHVIMLLDSVGKTVTVDRIVAYDFMATYSKVFGFSDTSLNGENAFVFSELSVRRDLIKKAIKGLVVDGLVLARNDKAGVLYMITEMGHEMSSSFQSDYAYSYKKNMALIIQRFENVNDIKLFDEINRQSAKFLRRQ